MRFFQNNLNNIKIKYKSLIIIKRQEGDLIIDCCPAGDHVKRHLRLNRFVLMINLRKRIGNNFWVLNFMRRTIQSWWIIDLEGYWKAASIILMNPALLVALYNEFSSWMTNFESFCSFINGKFFYKYKLNQL
jgi:hypothetical protein